MSECYIVPSSDLSCDEPRKADLLQTLRARLVHIVIWYAIDVILFILRKSQLYLCKPFFPVVFITRCEFHRNKGALSITLASSISPTAFWITSLYFSGLGYGLVYTGRWLPVTMFISTVSVLPSSSSRPFIANTSWFSNINSYTACLCTSSALSCYASSWININIITRSISFGRRNCFIWHFSLRKIYLSEIFALTDDFHSVDSYMLLLFTKVTGNCPFLSVWTIESSNSIAGSSCRSKDFCHKHFSIIYPCLAVFSEVL